MDVNNDGLVDIVMSGSGTVNNQNGRVLVHTKEHKYVDSYATVIDAFRAQSVNLEKLLTNTAGHGQTGIVFVKGPDDKMYLATMVGYLDGGTQKKAIYLSQLGATTANAPATVASIKQVWPWMNSAQINRVLAASSTDFYGMSLLDNNKIWNPIGPLGLPDPNRPGQTMSISGWISGVNIDNAGAVALDSIGRSYNINMSGMNVTRPNAFQFNMEHNDTHELTSHAEYLVAGPKITYNGIRIGTESRYNTVGQNGEGPTTVNQQFTNYTVGIPKIWSKGPVSFGTQYTTLNQNPWLSIGGAWGTVTNSGIMDNVITYRAGGFSTQASFMHVTTNITPGLVNNISNITGGWAESGYRYNDSKGIGDIGVYVGVKPVIFSGSVDARIPTAVDNSGNVVYTNKNMAIQNQTTTYVRAMYTNMLNRDTQYRLSGMVLSTGQYRIMHELRWWIN
jgi:hypothetical protein